MVRLWNHVGRCISKGLKISPTPFGFTGHAEIITLGIISIR